MLAAFGLAACGGGGGSTATAPATPTMMPDGDGEMPVDPAIAQREAISTAIGAANAAVAEVNDAATDADVTAAEEAVAAAKAAIEAAADVPATETALNSETVAAIEADLTKSTASRQMAMDAAAEAARLAHEAAAAEEAAAMAATGKALKAALGTTPLAYDATVTALTSRGVTIMNDADQTGPITPGSTGLIRTGASVGSLGSWKGTNYITKNPGTRVTNQAVLYTNQAEPTVKAFATGATFGGVNNGDALTASNYTATTRTLDLGSNHAGGTNLKSEMFPTAGTTNYTPTSPSVENTIRGTYQGAPGTYRCTGATGCAAAASTGGGVTLVGDWVFVHDTGAMTSKPDSAYLVFGWWLNKNKDDKPTAASAFTHEVGDVEGGGTFTDPADITGSATYSGHAAGKFAISDPINGASVFPVNPKSEAEAGLPVFHPAAFTDFSTGMTIIRRSLREQTAPTRGPRAQAHWRG